MDFFKTPVGPALRALRQQTPLPLQLIAELELAGNACAVQCQQHLIARVLGGAHPELLFHEHCYCLYAQRQGWFSPLEGTRAHHLTRLLSHLGFGVEERTDLRVSDFTGILGSGRGILLAVNASVLWRHILRDVPEDPHLVCVLEHEGEGIFSLYDPREGQHCFSAERLQRAMEGFMGFGCLVSSPAQGQLAERLRETVGRIDAQAVETYRRTYFLGLSREVSRKQMEIV